MILNAYRGNQHFFQHLYVRCNAGEGISFSLFLTCVQNNTVLSYQYLFQLNELINKQSHNFHGLFTFYLSFVDI